MHAEGRQFDPAWLHQFSKLTSQIYQFLPMDRPFGKSGSDDDQVVVLLAFLNHVEAPMQAGGVGQPRLNISHLQPIDSD